MNWLRQVTFISNGGQRRIYIFESSKSFIDFQYFVKTILIRALSKVIILFRSLLLIEMRLLWLQQLVRVVNVAIGYTSSRLFIVIKWIYMIHKTLNTKLTTQKWWHSSLFYFLRDKPQKIRSHHICERKIWTWIGNSLNQRTFFCLRKY